MVNSESADPKFSIGSNWKNRFYPMNEQEDVLLCDKVRAKGWTEEKIATEIPVWVQMICFQIPGIQSWAHSGLIQTKQIGVAKI